MGSFLRDVRHSLRLFRSSPGFTIAAVAALALGIGVNTAVFSLVNAVLLKPLKLPGADRAVHFRITYQGGSYDGASMRAVDFWRDQTNLFEDVSASRMELMNLTGEQTPEQLATARVTSGFFPLFGAQLAMGRTFSAEEESGRTGHYAVLSNALWSRRFGGDPHIIGR